MQRKDNGDIKDYNISSNEKNNIGMPENDDCTQNKNDLSNEEESKFQANHEDAPIQTQDGNDQEDQLEALRMKLEEKEKEVEEYKSLCQRVAADFDNYKKRIAKDKENMYFDVVADVVGKLLPIVDNFERAISSAKDGIDKNDEFLKGLEMIKRQIDEIFSKLGVEPIEALNKEFDPFLHNAILHVEDERYGKNIVVEELQKGYKIKDRVIRYSLVKVANAN